MNTATCTIPRPVGRPATGCKTDKLSASVPMDLLAAIKRAAVINDEPLSQFVSRALQAALVK